MKDMTGVPAAQGPPGTHLLPGLAGRRSGVGLDASRGALHLVRNRVAQRIGGDDDAGRDEGEQKRIFNRRNAIFVRS